MSKGGGGCDLGLEVAPNKTEAMFFYDRSRWGRLRILRVDRSDI